MKTTYITTFSAILLAGAGITVTLQGQDKDPFVKDKPVAAAAVAPEAKQAAPQRQIRNMMGILLEYVEVDHLDAVRLIRKHGGSLNSTKLREELDDMIQAKRAKLLDTVYTPCPSGQRVNRLSILEQIYPTEYDPPEVPQTMMLHNKEGGLKAPFPADTVSGAKTAANPTAFEVRNVGATIEVDPVIAADGKTIDLNVAPEIVTFNGWRFYMDPDSPHSESKDLRMPKFSTMKTQTAVKIIDGQYALLGCHTPHDHKGKRVLALLKVDILK